MNGTVAICVMIIAICVIIMAVSIHKTRERSAVEYPHQTELSK